MTIRDRLKSQMFKARCVALGCWLLFVAGLFLPKNLAIRILMLIPFIGFAGSVLYMLLVVRCPRCKVRLGQTFGHMKQANFCPGCGISFDTQA